MKFDFFVESLGVRGKVVVYLNYLAVFSIMLMGIGGLIDGIVFGLVLWFLFGPLAIITLITDIIVLASYFNNRNHIQIIDPTKD